MVDRRLEWVVVLGVGLVAAGCGSNMGLGSTGPAGTATEFFAQFCDIYRPCCQAAGLRSDGVQCRALYGALTPAGRFDGNSATTCLNATRTAASQPGFCEGNIPDAVECSRVFQVSTGKALGEACSDGIDCAPSSEGAVKCASEFTSTGTQIRKCQLEIRGQAGSSLCLWTVDGALRYSSGTAEDVAPRGYACYVSDGLRCDDASGTCVALAPVGGGCLADDECVRGAFCNSGTSSCVARQPIGGTCGGVDFQCASTAYCASTLMCTVRQATGTACTESAQCTSGNCVNSLCDAGAGNFVLAFLCGEP